MQRHTFTGRDGIDASDSELYNCMTAYSFSAMLFVIKRESKYYITESRAAITGDLLLVKLQFIN